MKMEDYIKFIILVIMMCVFCSFAFAYVPIEEYKGVKLKFYDSDGEKDFIYNYIDKYDLKGLKWIEIFPEGFSRVYGGYYYPYQVRLFIYDEWIFVHELAHHYNCVEYKMCITHDNNFYKFEEEIWESSIE